MSVSSKRKDKSAAKPKWKTWRSESTKTQPNVELLGTLHRKWRSEENMLAKAPSSVPYYYGHITRENAELVLWDRGCKSGMYLLRATNNRDAEYVLSVANGKEVLHYLIQKSADGLYFMSGLNMDKHVGPVELIENLPAGSLPFKHEMACIKPVSVFMPGVNCGITEDRLQEALNKKAIEWGMKDEEMQALLHNRESDGWKLIFKTLHESEGWYHGKISRSEAEKRLTKSGHKNGKFLIRERDECSFSLSLSFNNQPKHYKIDVLPSGEVGIPDGPRFENIISLVSHYSVFPDGLWCCLKIPCLNMTSPSPSSAITNISWPIERNCHINNGGERAKESFEPAFPLNRPVFGPQRPFLPTLPGAKSPDSEPLRLLTIDNTFKSTSKNNLNGEKSPVPQTPPSPIVTTPPAGAASNLPPRKLVPLRPPPPPPIKKSSLTPVIENVPFAFNPKVPTVTKDQNHNDCLENSNESKKSAEDVKNKPLPVPRRRKLPLPILLPPNEAPKTKASPVSPPEVLLPPPPSLASKTSPSALVNVLAELKKHKVMKDPAPPPPPPNSVLNNLSPSANVNNQEDEVWSKPQLQRELSCYSAGEPNYEEIDPEYEDQENQNGCEEGQVKESLMSEGVQESKWDELEESTSTLNNRNSLTRKPPWTKEESELHFHTIKRHTTSPLIIDRKSLVIQERLGLGNFGEVSKALFRSGKDEVPCAVKMLKQEQLSNAKEEILREARIMTKMDHPHIVRLIGICEGDPFLLVMELAPLGPLSSYLKRNPGVNNSHILLLMYQVAMGMEYLESRQFVHRDLAARNVLLVNEKFAKITDFGMSKALGLHSDYYTVAPQGRLPLKWYAPECIYYFKFSSKSDVWSYGITLWEAFSRGGKPYLGLTGREIIKMFGDNSRMDAPVDCPPEIYDVMNQCWAYRSEDRPSFSQLVSTLKEQLNL